MTQESTQPRDSAHATLLEVVAICERDDAVLRPLAEKYGIEIVCYGDALP